jgi:hypothetical protein
MNQNGSNANADSIKEFEKRTREVFASEVNRERVGELAYNNYKTYMGCAQSMLHAFQEVLEFKDDFWFKAMGGLQGGGMCGLTCGALLTGFVLINARVGRTKIEEGFLGVVPPILPSHQLFHWFKPMYKSTVCSEISGVNWLDLNEVVQHYMSPKALESIEKCARLTGGTATKVAEMLSQL